MKSNLKRPFLNPTTNKKKTLGELDRDRKDKEDRFKEIAYSQPPAQLRKTQTPQETPYGNNSHTPRNNLSQGMTPKRAFLKPQGVMSPPSEGVVVEDKQDRYQDNLQHLISQQHQQHQNLVDEVPGNLYIEPQPAFQPPFFFGDGIQNPVMQVRRNMAISIGDAVNESICFNTVILFVSSGKVIAYLFLLLGSEQSCKHSLTVWFLLMFVHDILQTYYTFLLLRTIRDSEFHEDPSAAGGFVQVPRRLSQIVQAGEPRQLSNQFLNEVDEWEGQRQINAFAIQERASSSNQLTNILNSVTKYLFVVLFVVGNYIVLGDEVCPLSAPNHFDLAVFYIIIGYAYLGMPIILFSSLCLCLPLVLIMIMLVGRREGQQPIRRDLLEALEKVKFTPQFQGNKDCCICMVDYKDGDDVTILPCSRIHHFHEECVKKWLLINGVCPICRRAIEESVQQLVNREL